WRRLPRVVIGASLLSVDRARSSPLVPPWPDLVISIGHRSAHAARWIRRQSGGRTRLVVLGRPRAPLGLFDLVVTTPQYGLPRRANVIHNLMPLHHVEADRLDEAAAHWSPRLAHLPKPRFALLVGGASSPYRMDAAAAGDLGRRTSA